MKLVLLTLPIGNPGDLTLRAQEILNKDGVFLSEDTRVFKDFLKRNEFPLNGKEILSFHDHNQNEIHKYLDLIKKNIEVFIVSDAGSPIISDPAFPLVRSCLENNISLQTIPGVSSPLVALELSGLPPIPFHFHGFLPREKGKIKSFFDSLNSQNGTHLFFESPHRITSTLNILAEALPENEVAVGRELTKTFESVYRFKASEFSTMNNENWVEKGEFTIAIHVAKRSRSNSSKVIKLAQDCLDKNGHQKALSKLLAEILELDQKDVYKGLSN